jgi:hypothetical protein
MHRRSVAGVSHRGGEQVRQGDDGDREVRAHAEREQGRQQTADAEPYDGRGSARQHADREHRDEKDCALDRKLGKVERAPVSEPL